MMKTIRDVMRPVFRIITHPYIKKMCSKTRTIYDSYENKHLGETCFIVANGPSLRIEDLDYLQSHNIVTFGMNRIYAMYDKTIWRPTYYLTQDPTVIRSCIEETRKQVDNSIVFAKLPGEPKYDIPGAVYYDLDYTNVDKHIAPDFYDGKECVFADGRSVMHTALQLAYFMGFKNIYLIGADCSYSKDNKSINKDSYPDPRMYDAKKVGVPPDMQYTFSAYEVAKEYLESRNVKIFNATRGGMLEVLTRVNLDEVFRII